MSSVSHSEVEAYLLCRRKQYYGYTLGLKRVAESTSLSRGSMGHKVLETFYRSILSAGDDVDSQQSKFDDAMSEAYLVLEESSRFNSWDDDRHIDLEEQLFDWYFPNESITRRGWQILAVEASFNLLYDDENDLSYPFVVDLIAYDPQGQLVVIDHKFVYDFYSPDTTELQPQIPKYIGALRALNYPINYGAYNMLRTRPLKKGNNYPEDRSRLVELHPSTERVSRTFNDQIAVAGEIQARKKLTVEDQEASAFRVANQMICKSCSFRDLCSAELAGQDTTELLARVYKKRQRRAFTAYSVDATE